LLPVFGSGGVPESVTAAVLEYDPDDAAVTVTVAGVTVSAAVPVESIPR
jgi:hypothetical protein